MGSVLIDLVSLHDFIVVMIYCDDSCIKIKFDRARVTHEPCAALLGAFSDKEVLRVDHVHSSVVFDDHTGAVVIPCVLGKSAVFTDDITVAVGLNVFRAFRTGSALVTILAHQPYRFASFENLLGFHGTNSNRFQIS